MISESLERIRSFHKELPKSVNQVFARLQNLMATSGESLDMSSVVPNTTGSVAEIITRLQAAIDISKQISKLSAADLLLIPKGNVRGTDNQLDKINSSINNIYSRLNSLEKEWGLNRIDYPNLHLIRQDNDQVGLDLGAELTTLDSCADSLLQNLYAITNVVSSDGFGGFSSSLNSIRQMLDELGDVKKELSDTRKASRTYKTQIENNASAIKEEHDQVRSVVTELEKIREETQQKISDISNQLDDGRTVVEKAEALSQQVEQHHESYQEFERKLAERNRAFEDGKAKLEDLLGKRTDDLNNLVNELKALEGQISALKTESEHVLGHATAAGLASYFRNAGKRLHLPLLLSHVAFWISVGILGFSVLIIFDAVPSLRDNIQLPPITYQAADSEPNAFYVFIAIVSRFVVLLPGLLLAGYSVRWQKSLQRLSEEYTHKETVAASVPGFKEEAGEQFEHAIAAVAFENMLSNSQRNSNEEPAHRRQGSWLNRLIAKPLSDVVDQALSKKEKAG